MRFLVAVAIALSLGSPATAAVGYSYAGVSTTSGSGLAATVSLSAPRVGVQVAAWVGADLGARWLQVGVVDRGGGSRLYYEVGSPYQLIDLGPARPRERVAVLQTNVGWIAISRFGVFGPVRLGRSPSLTATAEGFGCNDAVARVGSINTRRHARWSPLRSGFWMRDEGWTLSRYAGGFTAAVNCRP